MINCAPPADVLFQQVQRSVSMKVGAAPAGEASLARARSAGNDLRNYGVGAQILRALGVRRMRLLSRPRKMPSMVGYGLEVTGFQNED